MPVSDTIFLPLTEIFEGFLEEDTSAEYLKKHRRRIKVLVDSLWEQICESFFGMKPRNAVDARALLNRRSREALAGEDQAIADALSEVLKNYGCLDSGPYMDVDRTLRPLLAISIRNLSLALTRHSAHLKNVEAKALYSVASKLER